MESSSSPTPPPLPLERPELVRSLTLFDGTMIVMGTIIGIGIFFTPSRVVGAVGSPAVALAAWVVGGLIAMTGAYTYAALGAIHPRTGGPYVYLAEGLGRLPAFLYGYMLLLAVLSGAIALIGLIFVDHLAAFVPLTDTVRLVAATGTIVLLAFINVVGVRWGSRVQNLFTVLKVVALLGLVAAGLLFGSNALGGTAREPVGAATVIGGFVSAMVGVLFSFGGWQNLTNVAGEMKDPARDLPRAILIGTVGVAVVYLLANVAYLRLLPADELARSSAPAVEALENAIGPKAGGVVAVLILCSAFGILNGLMLAGPRIYFAMARGGDLFRAFGTVHARFRTPSLAIAVQAAMAVLLLWVFRGHVADLTDYVVFADWLFFTLNGVALFAIIRRSGRAAAAGRRYGYPWVPAVFTALSAVVTVGVLIGQWQNAWKGLLILASGCVVFALQIRRPAAPRDAS